MKLRNIFVALAVTLGLAVGVTAPAMATAPTTSSIGTVDVVGQTVDGLANFTGQFDITRFTTSGGGLAAVGTLTGTLTDSLGTVIGTISQIATLPVVASGSCQVLHLELGPLDLDLLGLQI